MLSTRINVSLFKSYWHDPIVIIFLELLDELPAKAVSPSCWKKAVRRHSKPGEATEPGMSRIFPTMELSGNPQNQRLVKSGPEITPKRLGYDWHQSGRLRSHLEKSPNKNSTGYCVDIFKRFRFHWVIGKYRSI